jgi:flagellin
MADNDVTRIAGNIGAMNALYSLTNINKQLSIHQTRLATGKRINSAADDPAGLAISTKMLARSEGLKTALSNIGDAKNLLAVAESGLGRLNDILSSMRTITQNAANDTNGTDERDIVKEQLASYAAQINDIVDQTKWSDKKLISGSYNTSSLTFQTGVDSGETTELTGLADMHALSLSLLKDTTASAASISATAIGTSMTLGTGTFTTELASGKYRVVTTMSATTGVYTASLMNGTNGTVVMATAGGTFGTAGGASNVINFGNGLTVTLATSVYTAEVVATVSQTLGTNISSVSMASASGVATGTYDLRVTIAADGTTGTIGFGTGASYATVAFTYASNASQQVSLANGIKITVATGIAASDDKVGQLVNVNHVADSYALGNSDAFDYTKSAAAETGVVNISKTTVDGTIASTTTQTSLSADFSAFMNVIDAAMKTVNSQLSKIGSLTGSLTFKEDQVSSSQINVEASYNRIMNANMAEEQVNASKLLILQQTSTAMLAQANAAPQFLLSLFK